MSASVRLVSDRRSNSTLTPVVRERPKLGSDVNGYIFRVRADGYIVENVQLFETPTRPHSVIANQGRATSTLLALLINRVREPS